MKSSRYYARKADALRDFDYSGICSHCKVEMDRKKSKKAERPRKEKT
jgi:hypothetical protein